MIHELAFVECENIGKNTGVWQFCVVLKGAYIGSNCNLNCNVLVEGGAIIGDNVTIKPSVQIWEGVILQNDVFVGPNVTFTNDLFPRSNIKNFDLKPILVKKGASIGANSTVLAGVTIGENAFIGAGSLVTKDIPENEVWIGNPAKFHKKL